MRRIKSVTVATAQSRSYAIGDKVNGLEIARIKDYSTEFPDAIVFMYRCQDNQGEDIVEINQVPTIVEWEEIQEGGEHS